MEKEATEELQLLGAMGTVRETFNIVLRCSRSKLLWALVLTLLLPLSFSFLGSYFLLGPLLLKINESQIETVNPHGRTTRRELGLERRELLVVLAAYIAFVIALSLLSMAPVVYTVASIYTANTKKLKLSYIRVLSADVPRVWKRLTLTFLCFVTVSFVSMAASLLAIILLLSLFYPGSLFPSVGGEADNKLQSYWASLFGVIVVTVVVFCPQIYIMMVWHLASVVSILEDKYYGLAAMRKSSNLMKGKRITALVLLIVHIIFSEIVEGLFRYAVVKGRNHGLGIAARAVNGTVLLGLFCFVNLIAMSTHSVLYFVCKLYHHESIYDNSAFKIYNVGDYEALKTTSIQLEHLHAEV